MTDETDNVIKFAAVEKSQAIPENDYVVVTRDGATYFATGFLLFTSQHVAVMRDTGMGAMPVLVVPLDIVQYAEIEEDTSDEEVFD